MKTLKKTLLAILLLAVFVAAYWLYAYPYTIAEKSAFPDIRFANNRVWVALDGQEYECLAAEGEPIEAIQDFAKKQYRDQWQHRIGSDYIMLMKDMGHWTFFSTQLKLKKPDGAVVEKKCPLSVENREAVMMNEMGKAVVHRSHTMHIPDSLKYLSQRIDGYSPAKGAMYLKKGPFGSNLKTPMNSWLTKELAIEDLEHLEYQIRNRYSYADLKGVNYSLAIDAIIADLCEGISKRDFGIQIKRLLALFGDGHSRVSRSRLQIDSLFLPFQIRKVEGQYIAVAENKLYDQDYPTIISIDGLPIDSLQKIAGEMATKGSPQFYEKNSLDYLGYYGFMQQKLGLNGSPLIQFSNGKDTISKAIEMIGKKDVGKLFVRKKSHHKILDNNIGYIYLHKMDKKDEYMEWLKTAMSEFKNTKGLIIDIRGNGGGSRKPTYTLLSYFIKEPKVININALRINKDLDPNIDEPLGELEERMAYPEQSAHWNEAERQAIAQFKTTFNPQWKFDTNKFSKWHYSVVSPHAEHYAQKVIVLMDEGNFSAADIFLAAFKDTENITLMGTKSSGGSGFVRRGFLHNSGLMYLLSRMASFQPNGQLYDGNGVTPDIEVKPQIEDYKTNQDRLLKKAIEMIK